MHAPRIAEEIGTEIMPPVAQVQPILAPGIAGDCPEDVRRYRSQPESQGPYVRHYDELHSAHKYARTQLIKVIGPPLSPTYQDHFQFQNSPHPKFETGAIKRGKEMANEIFPQIADQIEKFEITRDSNSFALNFEANVPTDFRIHQGEMKDVSYSSDIYFYHAFISQIHALMVDNLIYEILERKLAAQNSLNAIPISENAPCIQAPEISLSGASANKLGIKLKFPVLAQKPERRNPFIDVNEELRGDPTLKQPGWPQRDRTSEAVGWGDYD